MLDRLPLLTVYVTDRCNSRCASCDHWRHGRDDLALDTVQSWLPDLARLGTRVVQFSGGEPLLHPQWAEMADLLRAQGLRLWLLTAGLALHKQAEAVAERFEQVTVSLDAPDRAAYLAIRGVDAFDAVCRGIRSAAKHTRVSLRVTVQRGNVEALADLVLLARALGVSGISFLSADTRHTQAFGRAGLLRADDPVALRYQDLALLEAALARLEREHAADFASGFIAESPAKLQTRLMQQARAVQGLAEFPPVHCNAPEHSAVIDAQGQLRPCFFIAGAATGTPLREALNHPAQRAQRQDIRDGKRPECRGCVCSKWFTAVEPLAHPRHRQAPAHDVESTATADGPAWERPGHRPGPARLVAPGGRT